MWDYIIYYQERKDNRCITLHMIYASHFKFSTSKIEIELEKIACLCLLLALVSEPDIL